MPTIFLRTAVWLVLAFTAASAQAQEYPVKPIRLIVGLAAGGSVDPIMRIYGEVLSRSFKQPLVLDNRPGAGGAIAAELLKQAAPDGYTLMVALSGLHTITPAMQTLSFDPLNDFTPVMLLYSTPTYLTLPASNPANSVAELAALARAKPGGLNYGSPGVGSPAHLMGVLLEEKFRAPMTHVAYKGGGQLVIDLIAGRVDFAFTSYTIVRGPLQKGQVKILAIAAPARSNSMPDIPTLNELGYPGVDVDPLFGLMAPLGTPAAIVQSLYDEFAKASTDASLIRRLTDLGVVTRPADGRELMRLLKTDHDRLGSLVKSRGIKSQ